MAESLVKSYLQRLDSLMIQEKEGFSGLEDDIEKVANKLKEIGQSFDDANELRDIINDMENHIQKFLSQTDDQTTPTDRFRNDLQKIDFRLSETVKRKKELKNSTAVEDDVEVQKSSHGIKGEASASSSCNSSLSFESDFKNLSEPLRNCLMYCCIFPENFLIHKGKLIRLLVAEGLIDDNKEGKVMEDIAEQCICELVNKGMLEINDEHTGNGTKLVVPLDYRELCLQKIEEGKLKASVTVPQRARRIVTSLDMLKDNGDHKLWSLFLIGNQRSYEEKSDWLKHDGATFLRVLDLESAKIKSLPDEVGEMTHLAYLCLKNTEIWELPESLGRLKALQTLDIRSCGFVAALPHGVLRLVNLRHLKMLKNHGVCGVKLPPGIGSLGNLLTLIGVDPSGGIGRELEPKHTRLETKLPLLDSFSPPLSLRKLRLKGALEKTPSWLGSMERLTNIRLEDSHLSENPALVLQHLPNLKNLTLWHGYDGKEMGKEFCRAGGFPNLEKLTIASDILEEWTEIEEGAFPSLKHFRLHSCMKLRMLPEGLQFVTALKRLWLIPLLDDHADRLKPDGGPENYKIKHIGRVSFFTTSMIKEMFQNRREEAADRDH
ncbi:hypothetical protein TIFTF001_015165 [Ficus carica]|uniref:Uncharacterized protein n=1 Tax=Ficus carica TaxID=3494 RepID=A0AA88D7M8_FICCA|nr:hypothetical protein TIFTF001_015165 [Ficus carica]